jgi:3-isopropylmalate dehydrogenase
MLLDHLGFAEAAAKVEQAVADDLLERGGSWTARTTRQIGDDIAARVAG